MNIFTGSTSTRQLCGALGTLLLIFTSLQKVSGDANYAAVIATGSGKAERHCMAHNEKFRQLPKSFDEAEWVTLTDLTHSSDDPYLCQKPKVVPILNDSAISVLRGNCSFVNKAYIAQDMEASAVIIVANELIIPNATHTSEYNGINITIGVILQEDCAEIMSTNKTVRVKMYAPSPLKADYSILLLAFLAISTLTVGAYWSGVVRYQIALHRSGLTVPGSSAWNTARREDLGAMPLTALTVVICVVIMVGVLLGLYFFYDYLVYVFIVIFGLSSGYALYDCISTVLMLLPSFLACRLPENKLPGFKSRPEVKLIVLCLLCLGVGIWWIVERHSSYAWILQDVLGVALCLHLLKQIRLTSFKVCFVLFIITFVYDIFFVFITPLFTKNGRSIMIDVATGGGNRNSEQSSLALSKDTPINTLPLLMISPRLGKSDLSVCGTQYSMLGFGDILIPGLLVSFCHGFDLIAHTGRVYYIATSIAYCVGLVLTWVALLLMQTGQPALLYIVPCLLTTTVIVGAVRKELRALWSGVLSVSEYQQPQLDLRDPVQPSLSEDDDDNDSKNGFARIVR